MPMPEDEPVDTAVLDEESADELPADEGGIRCDSASPVREGRGSHRATDRGAGVDTSVEVAAVAPRKVRTMIVKADGTLVAREEPVAPQPVGSASEGIVEPVASTAAKDTQTTATVPNPTSEQTQPLDAPAAPEPQQPAAETAASGNTPKTVPVAPARPSDQPVDIVGEVKAEQVAALGPGCRAGAGSWSMQIASQPTRGRGAVELQGPAPALQQSARRTPGDDRQGGNRRQGHILARARAGRQPQRGGQALRELQVGRRKLLRLEVAAGLNFRKKTGRRESLAPAFSCQCTERVRASSICA